MDAPRPTLDHCGGVILTYPMFINVYHYPNFDVKVLGAS